MLDGRTMAPDEAVPRVISSARSGPGGRAANQGPNPTFQGILNDLWYWYCAIPPIEKEARP